MQGLVVVGLIVEKLWNVNANCVSVTGARNICQGHRVWCTCQVRRSGRCVMQGVMAVVEL